MRYPSSDWSTLRLNYLRKYRPNDYHVIMLWTATFFCALSTISFPTFNNLDFARVDFTSDVTGANGTAGIEQARVRMTFFSVYP